jgi:multidrug efflux pump subunit AcrB
MIGLVGGGFVGFEFLPPVEADYVSASLTMPKGTPADVTAAAVRRLEQTADQLAREVEQEQNQNIFQHVYSAVGEQPFRSDQDRNGGGTGSQVASGHLGEVTLELIPAEDRAGLSSEALARRWRELTGTIPDAVELTFRASIFSAGEDINVELTGRDLDKLREAASRLKARLSEYSGVYEIADSFRDGKREVKLNIKPEAEALGLTLSDLGRQVRQAFFGEEAQRIQRGRDDIRVMVRYPVEERRSLGDLESMRIRTPDGNEVPFSQVATVDMGRGYASIKRVDRRRAVNVTADVDPSQASTGAVVADLKSRVLPEILADYPGVTAGFEGQSAEQRESLGGLQRGFALALIGIYALLAIPLRSYTQPIIIMSAIPFGLVGAIAGHLIMGINLTILSMFGIVALAGVVVNDSLVMVDFINRKRETNESLVVAVREAGIVRFRPILLTSVTTFAGLFPLIIEKSLQAQFLIPMAVSLAFGVVFSTVISLMLVPAGYMVLDDVKRFAITTRRYVGRMLEKTEQETRDPQALKETFGHASSARKNAASVA